MRRAIILLAVVLFTGYAWGQSVYNDVLEAVSLSSRGENEAALGVLRNSSGVDQRVDLLVLRGDIFLRAGKVTEARSDFMKAERMQQGAGLYGLARCAATEGQAGAAASYLEAYLKTAGKKDEPEIMLDGAFNPIANSVEWRSLWKKEWYRGYERLAWEIEHYISSGKNTLAMESMDELRNTYPDRPVTEYCEALLMMSKGRYGEAATVMEKVAAGSSPEIRYLRALAKAYTGEGNYSAAAAVYSKMIDREVPDPGLFIERARMLVKAGDRAGAKADMERYLTIDPENHDALSLIGKTYIEAGEIYEALPYLNMNVEKHPEKADAFSLRGEAWQAARSWEKAAEDYTMSLDLNPEEPEVNLNLGISLINIGKTSEACHYLRKAKSLGEKGAVEYLSKYCIR